MTRLWRWLCCRTGHHRETVVESMDFVTETIHYTDGSRGYRLRPQWRLTLCCTDCPHEVWRMEERIFTPSRRYALRRQGTV